MSTPISKIVASNLLDPSIMSFLGQELYPKAFGKLLGGISDDMEVESKISVIPSETTIEERRFLYNFFRHIWNGQGNVFEVGPFLGGTTRAIALGMTANENNRDLSKLLTYDSWDYGDKDFIYKTLEPTFASGHLTDAQKNEFLANPTQKQAFELLHRNQNYYPLISVEPYILPKSPEEARISNKIIRLSKDQNFNAFFIDGCKCWYSTKYFLQQIASCATVGSHFIFQDHGWYTCFWVSTIMELFQDHFSLHGFVDTTYYFQLVKPLSPEIVSRLCPDTAEGLSSEQYHKIYNSIGYKAGIRGDTKGMVVSKLHLTAALATIGRKKEAKEVLEKISTEPWAATFQNEISRARIQPTYDINGAVLLEEEAESSPSTTSMQSSNITASSATKKQKDVSELTIYVPAQIKDAFLDVVNNIGESNGFVVRMTNTLQSLDAASLSCMTIRDNRSQRHSRSPFAYPFTSEASYFTSPTNNLPVTSVDWLFLGGDANNFLQMLLTCILTHSINKVCIVPFERIVGEISQEIQQDEIATCVKRAWHSNNEPTVAKHMQELLTLNPDEWLGLNGKIHLVDLWPKFQKELAKNNFNPKTIVDLGCGLAHLTRSASRAFPEAQVKGIDISPSTVRVINTKLGGPNLSFQLGTMENVPNLPDKSQDLIISTYALNQALDQTAAAKEAFRMLAPGGQLMAYVVSDSYFSFWRFPYSSIVPPDAGFINEEWRKVAQDHGYKLEVRQIASDIHYLQVPVTEEERRMVSQLQSEVVDNLSLNQPWGHNFQVTAAPGEDQIKVNDNYLDQLQNNILTLLDAPHLTQELTKRIWCRGSEQAQLAPQAIDFLGCCLPKAKAIIRDLMLSREVNRDLHVPH